MKEIINTKQWKGGRSSNCYKERIANYRCIVNDKVKDWLNNKDRTFKNVVVPKNKKIENEKLGRFARVGENRNKFGNKKKQRNKKIYVNNRKYCAIL